MPVVEALASVEAAVLACRRAASRGDAAAVESGAEDLAFAAAALRQALENPGSLEGAAGPSRSQVIRVKALVASTRPWLDMPLEVQP